MPVTYAYRCRECGSTYESFDPSDTRRCECGSVRRRDYRSIQLQPTARSFVPHFNQAVGKYVSSQSEFHDELKRASERASIRSGLDHDFTPKDHRETPPEMA